MRAQILENEIKGVGHHLWIVAEKEAPAQPRLVGAVMFRFDSANRLGKAAGGVVLPEFRKLGIGAAMVRSGVRHLTQTKQVVDIIYGTTRTVTQGPSKMVAEVGFREMGLFPNAVHIEEFEHLNLDIYLTDTALKSRRKKPFLFSPFYEVYGIARRQLSLERAILVTEREPLQLSRTKIPFRVIRNEKTACEKFLLYSNQNRISNSFFPFHLPNWLLSSEDGGTDVFIWHGGVGKQSSILGYRTDRVNAHDVLDSVAHTLQRSGAAYVELLVDAYDYMLQQEAYTARYIPSGYFPALRLGNDRLRDDYFVLSRTFQLLDFRSTYVSAETYPYLQAYMRCYNELYLEPTRFTHRQPALSS